MIRIGLIGTNNTHGHQFAGFINGWRHDVPIPTRVDSGMVPQFYLWAKTLRELESAGDVPCVEARVTRLWSESPDTEGALVAEACGITDVVDAPEDAAKDVDAVLLLTDDPHSHFDIAAPILHSGLPLFVDKPLAPEVETAQRLSDVAEQQHVPWFTGSAFRFSPSLAVLPDRLRAEIGVPTAIYVQCPGSIDRYGIHALEILNVLVGRDVRQMEGLSLAGRNSVLLEMENGVTALLEIMAGTYDPQGQVIAWGDRGSLHWECRDVHRSVFGLVRAFLNMVRTGKPPVPAAECLELARLALDLAVHGGQVARRSPADRHPAPAVGRTRTC